MANRRFVDKDNAKDIVRGLHNAYAAKGDLTSHVGDTSVHFTSSEREKLAGIEDGAQVDTNTTYRLQLSGATASLVEGGSPSQPGSIDHEATSSASGLMSATDKAKLDTIAQGAEANQFAFSTVRVDQTDLSADAKTDTVSLVSGTNVTLTANQASDTVTISAAEYTASEDTVGSASEGEPITADDITAWSPGTLPSASLSGATLVLTSGIAPTLAFDPKTIPNVSVSEMTVVTGISVQ